MGTLYLPDIDSFLKIVSFAERRKIVCYGYRGVSNGVFTDFYRGDIAIPKENFEHSINAVLIDGLDFQEFVLQALENTRSCAFREHLFDAIGKAAYRDDSTLESEYLSYYSALENLVNGYRDTHNFHYILENDTSIESNDLWRRFSKDLKSFIKSHEFFKGKESQEENEARSRQLIYEKIPELNRISFGTAFTSFCAHYRIDLSDLWMIQGRGVHTSLSKIRNRLIHGGRFERDEYTAVNCAKNHLKWALERCILRVLDWDIERSKVCSSSLSRYIDYKQWQNNMNLLRSN